MTILNIRSCGGNWGGAETVINDAARGLNKMGFPIVVGCLHKPTTDIANVLERLRAGGIETIDLPGRRFFDIRPFRRLTAIIAARGIRVVHCHDYKADFYGLLLRRRFPRITLFATVHGWNRPSKKGALYNRLDKFFLRRFHAVIAVSRQIEDIARSHGIRNLHLLRNAIDTTFWSRSGAAVGSSLPAARLIGFVGRLSPEKGPLDFVRLARSIVDQGAGACFVVAGDGRERDSLNRAIAMAGLEGRFELLGQLDVDALRRFYQRLDVLVMTSYSEGVPMTLLEAMAMGVPVVATRVGGVREVVVEGESGLLAAAGDVQALVRHVVAILDDPHLAASLARNGRDRVVREYSLKKNIDALASLYRGFLDAGVLSNRS